MKIALNLTGLAVLIFAGILFVQKLYAQDAKMNEPQAGVFEKIINFWRAVGVEYTHALFDELQLMPKDLTNSEAEQRFIFGWRESS